MIRVNNLQIEDMTLEEFLQVFPGSAKQYLDYRVQIVWFRNVFPEGAILPSNPEPDAFRTQDTYVCSCDVYRNVKDPIPASRRSGIASPRLDGEITEDGRKLDNPYVLSQIIAISNALETLGFMPDVLTNAEKEALERELLGADENQPLPEAVQQYNKETVTATVSKLPEELKIDASSEDSSPTEPDNNTANEEPEAPKPKRGRPTKAEIEARKAAEKAKESTKTEEKVTDVTSETAPEPTPEITPEVTTEVNTEESAVEENSSGITFGSLEEAEAVICNYRNLAGKTMKEIIEMAATPEGRVANSFLDWLTRSDHAQEKNPEAYAALMYIRANS